MEDKKFNEMSYDELAFFLIDHPEMASQIVDEISSFDKLFNSVTKMFLEPTHPDSMSHNKKVQEALSAITDYEYSDNRKSSKPKELTPEMREELLDLLDEYISLGYTPDKLRDYCEKRGFNFDELYDDNSLKEQYEYYGITYNIEKNCLSASWFSKDRYFSPQKQEKQTKLAEKEAELASLENEAHILSETEKQVEKENSNIGDR